MLILRCLLRKQPAQLPSSVPFLLQLNIDAHLLIRTCRVQVIIYLRRISTQIMGVFKHRLVIFILDERGLGGCSRLQISGISMLLLQILLLWWFEVGTTFALSHLFGQHELIDIVFILIIEVLWGYYLFDSFRWFLTQLDRLLLKLYQGMLLFIMPS